MTHIVSITMQSETKTFGCFGLGVFNSEYKGLGCRVSEALLEFEYQILLNKFTHETESP